MEHYALIKYAHLIPAVLLLIGFAVHAFMLWRLRAEDQALARRLRRTRLYSLPAMAVVALSMPLSGWWLVHLAGWPLGARWLLYSSVLFCALMLLGVVLHGRLGDWQRALGGAVPVSLTRRVSVYWGLMLALLLAIFALMGAKPY